MPNLIVNLTRGTVVCENAIVADGPLQRMLGLMGRRDLAPTVGMLLRPAPAIHSAFMRFALDAVFLDADVRVLRVVAGLRPWRAAVQRGAHAVLELAAGECARRGIEVGDRLALLDGPMEAVAWDLDATPERVSVSRADAHPLALRLDDEAMHVLVVTRDRRFRDTAALLLSRRGCSVSVADSFEHVVERAAGQDGLVIVIDAGRSLTSAAHTVATLEALTPPVGVVVVADEAEQALRHLPFLDRWGSFDALYAAVEDSHRNRSHRKSLVERD